MRVGWEATGPAGDLLAHLLAQFPAEDCERPELVVTLGAAGPGALESPPGRQVFFQGQVRGYRADNGIWLWDGASRAHVVTAGAALRIDVAPSSLLHPRSFTAGFLFVALVLALRHHGLLHLHSAGLVDARGRTILVSGTAGAGKSTVALTLANAGCSYLGDDAVFLVSRAPGAEVRVLSFPREFHVGPGALEAFPRLRALAGTHYADASDKRALNPEEAFAGAHLWEAPSPTLLLFPEVSNDPRTRLEALPRAEALGRMLHSAALAVVDGMPRATEQIQLLRQVCDAATAFELRLGQDALAHPSAVAELVLEASS